MSRLSIGKKPNGVLNAVRLGKSSLSLTPDRPTNGLLFMAQEQAMQLRILHIN
jgi:hypothetical protein